LLGEVCNEIRICFSVGNILLPYKAAGQANPTLKKQTLSRFATGRNGAAFSHYYDQ